MRCKPGKTTRTFCLKCQVQGEITGYISPMVHMRCPVCGIPWRTISAMCEYCRQPSGSPYYSECERCGNKKREKKVIENEHQHGGPDGQLFAN